MRVTTTSCLRQRGAGLVLLLCGILLLPFADAKGMTDIYKLSRTTGTAIDMSGASTIFGGCVRYSNGGSGLQNIGFSFDFDGQAYTQFSVNASGHMTLGQTAGSYYYSARFPEYTSQMRYPMIAPAYFHYGGTSPSGHVRYKVVGSAPNRVLVVQWTGVQYYYYQCYSSSSTYNRYRGNFQARLYEGSNRIEFWYGDMWEGTSSYYTAIGIARSGSRYISVYGNNFPNEIYVNGSSPTYNYHQLSSDPISYNTLYVFNPCQNKLGVVGDLQNGGTADMEDGDALLSEATAQRGSSQTFLPFSLDNPANGCDPVSYSATFSGPAAGDYYVVPGTVNVGESVSPQIVFTPGATGVRNATMTLWLSNGQRMTYQLTAEGVTRMDWIADIPEGGVPGMPSGSTLLTNVEVERNGSREVTPFTLRNTNPDGAQFPAEITYILDDPLNEYSLAVPGGTVEESGTEQIGRITIGLGGSSTPVITFAPTPDGSEYGSGAQEATLTVIADGEQRVFPIAAFAVAPALALTMEELDIITSDRNYFRGIVTCVGSEATVLELRLENTNRVDVVLHDFDIYDADGSVQQGAPRYPQALDDFGNLIRSGDYVLSTAPGVAPASDNPQVRFPLTIGPGESRTYYLTYVAQRPGKRYARAFLRSNAVNFYGPDIENFMPGALPVGVDEGVMTMEFYGRGIGGALASSADGSLDGLSLTFDPVKVGESVEAETAIYNTGECDLLVSADRAHLTTGDVSEFELLEVLSGATLVGQDYVIPSGGMATIRARFTPSRSGSRRATVLLQTNDSAVGVEGVTAPGVYYLNLYGVGRADLRAWELALEPAVLDGPGSSGVVRVENTSSEVIRLNGAALGGPDIAEITADPARPWPALPVQMEPGDVLEFGVSLNAAPGSEPGVRTAEMAFTYGDGEAVRAPISGLVGTRLLTATPGSMFDDVDIPTGTLSRRIVVLSNTGTFPVTLHNVRVEGGGAAAYVVGKPGRMVVDAGGFEFIEVTYAPSVPGNDAATLVIENNGTDGTLSIPLNAASSSTTPATGSGSTGTRTETPNMSREGEAGGSGGLELSALPNPARESLSVSVSLPEGGPRGVLQLLSITGQLLRQVELADGGSQQPSLRLDIADLSSGVYVLRLVHSGHVVSRSIRVVK